MYSASQHFSLPFNIYCTFYVLLGTSDIIISKHNQNTAISPLPIDNKILTYMKDSIRRNFCVLRHLHSSRVYVVIAIKHYTFALCHLCIIISKDIMIMNADPPRILPRTMPRGKSSILDPLYNDHKHLVYYFIL